VSIAALGRPRSPARPGPGPMPAPLLRALDLDVRRRVDGLLAGEFRATVLGPGTELFHIRLYQPGDDVRDIDWNVTARTHEPHVRAHIAERSLTSWLLLDLSPSMTFGTADRRKADVAEGVALALGYLSTRRGNRLGIITFGDGRTRILPPTQGRNGVLQLLMSLRGAHPSAVHQQTSLGEVLGRARTMFSSRAAVFIVTDLIGPRDWRRPLVHLAGRHHVLVVEVRDPRETQIPDVGEVWMVDPESGRQMRVDTSSHALRERFAEAAAAERVGARRDVLSSGAEHVLLSTAGDWLRSLASFLARSGARR
jgi:uncharacterized protein (DUF58 family)